MPRVDTTGTVGPTATSPTIADLTALRGGQERLLPVGEVAEELGVCVATVYRLCERGELPHVRIINSIRVRPRDMAAYVAATRTQDAQYGNCHRSCDPAGCHPRSVFDTKERD